MNTQYLEITARDPLVSRDGRPFGLGQGARMRTLPWLLPSVVAGSCRSAMVKAEPDLDFSNDMPNQLLQVAVAGVFPVCKGELYLPAPDDALAEANEGNLGIKEVHRLVPQSEYQGGVYFANGEKLLPVMLSPSQSEREFKPVATPAWWPVSQMAQWMIGKKVDFDGEFLENPQVEYRDHVCIDASTGTAEESKLFATAGLNLSHLPKFQRAGTYTQRYEPITLSARVELKDSTPLARVQRLDLWHPLGGERRMAHWKNRPSEKLWTCPEIVTNALGNALRIRMVLATPAVFANGWKPSWLDDQLAGTLPESDVRLKLVGVCNGRWKAVSGWSLQKINQQGRLDAGGKTGPKPIRRMVPAGSVYFFEVLAGDVSTFSSRWLTSVCDSEQERRDGFGVAVFGTW